MASAPAPALLVAAALLLLTHVHGRTLQQFDGATLRRLMEAQRTLQQSSPENDKMWAESVHRWSSYGNKWQTPCPEYVSRYTSQAANWRDKVIIHWCKGMELPCCGIGDRIRSIEDMMRTALLCKRGLVVKWEPVGMEHFFEPASPVDWRPESYGITKENSFAANAYELFYLWRNASVCTHPSPRVHTHTNEPLMTWENATFNGEQVAPYTGGRSSVERACVFNALFKPTEYLNNAMAEQRKKLFGDPNKDYVAVHLRFGGLAGEALNIGPEGQLRAFTSSVRCAKKIAEHLGITAPVVIIADNTGLRSLISSGQMEGIVGPSHPARHISTWEPKQQHDEDMVKLHTPTFVDMGLLAKARCVLIAGSGFAATAVEWGRPSCVIDEGDCARVVDQENRNIES